MLIVIILATFGCIAFTVMSVYLLTNGRTSVVNARLDSMDPGIVLSDESGITAVAERVAEPLNRILPISGAEAEKLQKQLLQAGYPSPDAVIVFRAIQVMMLLVFPAAVVVASIIISGSPKTKHLVWAAVAAGVGFYLPRYILQKKIWNRQLRITWGLPDALDLLVICVEAGLGLNAALLRVGVELKPVHPDIWAEFELVNLEIRVGRSREEALRNLVERTGVDDLRSFVGLMIQADRFGSSVGRAVRVFADSLRTKRRQRAEQAAQKAALKLLFPLTGLLFPTIIMIILGPALLNLIDLFSR
jgi:tight adherence protein C